MGEDMKKKEYEELVSLIGAVDVSSCYGVQDVVRLEVLASKATEEEYRRAEVEARGGIIPEGD